MICIEEKRQQPVNIGGEQRRNVDSISLRPLLSRLGFRAPLPRERRAGRVRRRVDVAVAEVAAADANLERNNRIYSTLQSQNSSFRTFCVSIGMQPTDAGPHSTSLAQLFLTCSQKHSTLDCVSLTLGGSIVPRDKTGSPHSLSPKNRNRACGIYDSVRENTDLLLTWLWFCFQSATDGNPLILYF